MTLRWLAALLLAAGCGQETEPAPDGGTVEESAIVVTTWSEKTELFLEYPALQVGRTSQFVIHLTDLSSFEPIRDGRVSVELRRSGGDLELYSVAGPSRPGHFLVDVASSRAGSAEVTVRLESDLVRDSHQLGSGRVWPAGQIPGRQEDGNSAAADAEEVTFLKEQQWTLDFATESVILEDLQDSLTVPATVQPASGNRDVVTAPVAGRLVRQVRLPEVGQLVEAGEKVSEVARTWSGAEGRAALQLAVEEADIGVASAERERLRMERLLAAGAVPSRRLEEAISQADLASARLAAAQKKIALYDATLKGEAGGGGIRHEVRSNISGVVTSRPVANGSLVEKGGALLELVGIDEVHVTGAIPEAHALLLSEVTGAEIEVAGSNRTIPAGRLAAKGVLVDPETRTLSITYLANNASRQFAIGQSLRLRLLISRSSRSVTVPAAALVDDGGQTAVFVQTGGESFERRAVTPVRRRGARVPIAEGLAEGERVVSEGAYLLYLASTSTSAPAHGHVH